MPRHLMHRVCLAALLLAFAATMLAPACRADEGALATDELGDVSLAAAEAELDDPDRVGYRRLMRLAQALDQAARRKPEDDATALLAARALSLYGGMSGRTRAHDLVEAVLRRDAKSVDALLLRAQFDWASGCIPCAERSVQEAARSAPDDARVHAAGASVNAAKGAQAITAPGNFTPQEARTDFYAAAVREYEKAAASTQVSALRRAGWYEQIYDIETFRGRHAQAGAAIRKAVELAPERGSLLEKQALHALQRKGNWKQASELAMKASIKGGSTRARELQANAMYTAWAEAWLADRAAGRSSEDTARMLEAARAVWADVDETMLLATSSPRAVPLARALLGAGLYSSRQGEYRDKDGDTPLANLVLNFKDTAHGDEPLTPEGRRDLLALADLLIADGANPNAIASQGSEPLLAAAARTGDAELFEKILAAGANPHQAGRSGTTALLAAAQLGDHEAAMRMADALLARKVEVDRRDNAKRTPLMLAAGSGNTALATALLKRGARLDDRDGNDFTPLDYAASAGQRKMSELLLAAGAEIATQSSACGTSDTVRNAERGGYKDLADLLRQRRKVEL